MKILDKSLNMDVQGQGCWSDCYIGGYWTNKTSTTKPGCSWHSEDWGAEKWLFW